MDRSVVYVVDDDEDLGASVARLLVRLGYSAKAFLTPEAMLKANDAEPASCVITDVMMGSMDGFAFAEKLRVTDPAASLIFMTAWPTTAKAVDAVRRHGGLDYLEKPIDHGRLQQAVAEGVKWSLDQRIRLGRLAKLTRREREVFNLLVKGYSTKDIARELDLSPRTIEDHRAQINLKTGATSLKSLYELADGASGR